jgi:hypothetical protein
VAPFRTGAARYDQRKRGKTEGFDSLSKMICDPITLVSNEENLSLVAPIFNEVQLIELVDSAFPACLGPGVPRLDETPIVGLNQTPSHSR